MVPKDVRETHEVAQTAETDEKKKQEKDFPRKCARGTIQSFNSKARKFNVKEKN